MTSKQNVRDLPKASMSIVEAAHYAGCSPGTIRNLMNADLLPWFHMEPGLGRNAKRYIMVRDMDTYLEERRNDAA